MDMALLHQQSEQTQQLQPTARHRYHQQTPKES